MMRFESTKLVCAATGISLAGLMAAAPWACKAQSTLQPSPAVTGSKIEHVVELFTSQGCSSCPKADALFSSYVEKPGILALSYSVDYWDYLGWRDTLASPMFTKRQKRYAKLRGDGQVYTPQVVVNGHTHTVGHSAGQVDGLLTQEATDQTRTWYAVSATPATFTISASPAARPATVWLVRYSDRVEVEIRRGENAGKTITYHNVVRDLTELGAWDGKSDLTKPVDPAAQAQLAKDEHLAVLVQDNETGRILGAARLK